MKSTIHAINGLVSSLLLNLGLTRLAESLDPVFYQNSSAFEQTKNIDSSAFTDWPCNFTPQSISEGLKSTAFTDWPCNFTPQAAN